MRQRVCVAWRLTELLVQVGGRGGEDLHAPALGSSPDAGPADGGGQGRTHRMRDATSGCMPIYAPAACAKRRARISFAGVPLRNASMIQRCAMCPKAIYLALPKLLAPAQVAERRIMEDCMVAAWEVATLGTQVPKGQTCPHSRNRTSVLHWPIALSFKAGHKLVCRSILVAGALCSAAMAEQALLIIDMQVDSGQGASCSQPLARFPVHHLSPDQLLRVLACISYIILVLRNAAE